MNKKTADTILASTLTLFVASVLATFWLDLRYQEAETAFQKNIGILRFDHGHVVTSAGKYQAAANSRLHLFLIAGGITLFLAIALIIQIFMRRRRRNASQPTHEQAVE